MSLFIKTSLLLMMADLFILSGFILSGEAGVFFVAAAICAAFDFFVLKIVYQMEVLQEHARKMAEGKNVVVEGRDIGTNVFPNADVKIYLDASAEERANRRMKQNEEKGIKMSYEEILENIKFRDNNDKTSPVAPLKQADDAVYVDSTNMTIEEVVDKIVEIVKSKGKGE